MSDKGLGDLQNVMPTETPSNGSQVRGVYIERLLLGVVLILATKKTTSSLM